MTQYNEIPTLTSKIRDLERRMLTQETAPRLASSSIGDGGIRSEDFNGSGPSNPGTTGWAIGSDDGAGYAIFNDIILRDNIIGDNALANALRVVTTSSKGTGFAIGSTFADVTPPASLVVPDGFTQCGIIAIGTCNAMRSRNGPTITFSPESIGMWIKIDGLTGEGFNYNPTTYGDVGNLTTSFAPTLTGLTGGQVIPFSLQMIASPAQNADPGQFALVNLMAVFT